MTLAVFAAAAFLWIFGGLLRDVRVGGLRPLAGSRTAASRCSRRWRSSSLPVDRAKGIRAMDWETP